MTSPTRPEQQVEVDLTAAGNPEGEPTERGQSQDIEAEIQLSRGDVQATMRLRDAAGRTSVSLCHVMDVCAVAVWPVIALIICNEAKATSTITLWAPFLTFILSLIMYKTRRK